MLVCSLRSEVLSDSECIASCISCYGMTPWDFTSAEQLSEQLVAAPRMAPNVAPMEGACSARCGQFHY